MATACHLIIPDMYSITVPENSMKAVDFYFTYDDGLYIDFDGWKDGNGRFLGSSNSRVQVALTDVNNNQKVGCLLSLDLGKSRNQTFQWRLSVLKWLTVTDIGCTVTRVIDDSALIITDNNNETLINWLSRVADSHDEIVQDIMKYQLYQ